MGSPNLNPLTHRLHANYHFICSPVVVIHKKCLNCIGKSCHFQFLESLERLQCKSYLAEDPSSILRLLVLLSTYIFDKFVHWKSEYQWCRRQRRRIASLRACYPAQAKNGAWSRLTFAYSVAFWQISKALSLWWISGSWIVDHSSGPGSRLWSRGCSKALSQSQRCSSRRGDMSFCDLSDPKLWSSEWLRRWRSKLSTLGYCLKQSWFSLFPLCS